MSLWVLSIVRLLAIMVDAMTFGTISGISVMTLIAIPRLVPPPTETAPDMRCCFASVVNFFFAASTTLSRAVFLSPSPFVAERSNLIGL